MGMGESIRPCPKPVRTTPPLLSQAVPAPDPARVQLLADINAVFGSRTKSINDFAEPYRSKILVAYRFTGTNMLSNNEHKIPMIRETLDAV